MERFILKLVETTAWSLVEYFGRKDDKEAINKVRDFEIYILKKIRGHL